MTTGSRLGLVILAALLTDAGCTSSRGLADPVQAPPAQPSPQNDPANQHTFTVKFDYDFQKKPSCAEKPKLKTCIKQFNVYDVSSQRIMLFSIPVPDGARGFVKGITAVSPTRIFLPGTHLLGITAQNAEGIESPIDAAKLLVQFKSKSLDSNSSAK